MGKSFCQISTTNRVVSVRVTGNRTPDLVRAQQPFSLDHWRFWDKVLTFFSETNLSVVKPKYCYVPPQRLMKVSCESGRGIRAEIQTFRLSPKLARGSLGDREVLRPRTTQ